MTKIEKAIKEMREELNELDSSYALYEDKLKGEAKQKAETLIEKTKTAINNSIDKILTAKDEIKKDKNLDEFLDMAKAKTMEAVELAKDKIDALANNDVSTSLSELSDQVLAEFDNLKENEIIKKTTVIIKEIGGEINEFLQKPEVKEQIDKAKKTTINLAEKGVEGLKKVLSTENKKK